MCLLLVFSEISNKEINVNKKYLKLDNQDKKVGITVWFKMFIRITILNSGTTSLFDAEKLRVNAQKMEWFPLSSTGSPIPQWKTYQS